VVCFSAGSATDIAARVLAGSMSQILGQEVAVAAPDDTTCRLRRLSSFGAHFLLD
jgi:hypothetical protein